MVIDYDEHEPLILRLQPGDVLALQFPGVLSREVATTVGANMKAVLAKAGHQDVPVAVLMDGVTVAIIRQADDLAPVDVLAVPMLRRTDGSPASLRDLAREYQERVEAGGIDLPTGESR